MPSLAELHLVPVIDLKDGMVVHAREGRREEYRPVRSELCSNAEPKAVVGGLLALHPFRVLYVADLDAIGKQVNNLQALREIRSAFPDLELWVDSGIADDEALDRWIAANMGRPVIGSESLADADFLPVARQRCETLAPVLSLDFSGEKFKGPEVLLADPGRYWPERVLAMNLRRVGSGIGPDLALITALAGKKSSACEVYAAGGIRSAEDLEQAAAAGAAGALIATALHDGSIGAAELSRFAKER